MSEFTVLAVIDTGRKEAYKAIGPIVGEYPENTIKDINNMITFLNSNFEDFYIDVFGYVKEDSQVVLFEE